MAEPRSAIARTIAIIENIADADDLAWLRRGFAQSFLDGVSLDLALGLPSTPARRRTALRDFWLERAAAECADALPWRRACELAGAARAFKQRKWPRWRAMKAPPADASKLDQALYYLHSHGGRVPSVRRLYDLICETTATNREDIAVRDRIASNA